MDIDIWAEELLKDVCEKWETSGGEYSFRDCGFRVFYSPIRLSPELMVIGYNPGKDDKPFSKGEDSHIPEVHEYLYHDSRIARKMKYLFESIEREDWLADSVKLNLVFFGSEDDAQWEAVDRGLRDELETFCFKKVNEIIDTLKPRYIVTEGLKVFDILTNSVLMGCSKTEVKNGVGGRKIYARSRYGYTQIIGLVHLTKDRISYPDWNSIKKYLKADLKDSDRQYLH
jgi:hypothetical protein